MNTQSTNCKSVHDIKRTSHKTNVVYQVCKCEDEATAADNNKSTSSKALQEVRVSRGARHLSPSSIALRVYSVGFQQGTPVDNSVATV
jgi:hypothetical protein